MAETRNASPSVGRIRGNIALSRSLHSCLMLPRCARSDPIYSEAHLSKQNRSQAVGQATAYAERARARAGSHVRRAMRQHQARACHTASAAMLRMAREGGVGCAGATMVDAQHARRPRVGGMRRHAHAWESVMVRNLPNRRPCTLSSQSTSAAPFPLQLRCSTTSSGNRRHLADCRPRLLPPGSTPSLPRLRSRRRWLPARHPVASPVALPSRPDGREAPPVT